MRFLMLVCRDETIPFAPEDRGRIGEQVGAWVAEMQERGVRLMGEVLAPVAEAATVAVRHGETAVTRGPRSPGVAPSGFNLIECADLEQAIEVSAAHPIARYGSIELRTID
jgi:hypothetical protein